MQQKKVAIVQSNYIPWKGYFDLIRKVDEFILFDDMQFTRRDWRNRNQIKTPKGRCWLTIPVESKGKYYQKIKDTRVSDPSWPEKHWNVIRTHYQKAQAFKETAAFLEELYLGSPMPTSLSEINYRFLTALCQFLDISPAISWSMDYQICDGKTERLVEICKQAGATEYISGPSAKDYIEETVFSSAGIQLTWMAYPPYTEYPQLHPPFDHGVSIIDLILNTGQNAVRYLEATPS